MTYERKREKILLHRAAEASGGKFLIREVSLDDFDIW